jgi:hypothetical protein
MIQKKRIIIVLAIFLSFNLLNAQYAIQGTIQSTSSTPIVGANITIVGYNQNTKSDEQGKFEFAVSAPGNYTLIGASEGFLSSRVNVFVDNQSNTGEVLITLYAGEERSKLNEEDIIPIISIDESSDQSQGSESVSGILTASRDVFVSTAAFTLGPLRFRIRGLDGIYSNLHINGIPMNDIENGRVSWNTWGGLNDVLRDREVSIGVQNTDYGFGNIGGVSNINMRAANQWKQTRFSTAVSNRNYRQRLMFTHNTSLLNDKLHLSLSFSRRFANEGYIAGTFYDAWSYFTGLEYIFNKKHSINFSFIGSSIQSGSPGSSFQEANDLAGTNFYNPNWGYQNGQKRNARVRNVHQPIAMLNHDYKVSNKTAIHTGLATQFGRTGTSAIDWYNAPDPRPDYYRKLPSFAADDFQRERITELFQNDEDFRQINWHKMYDINRNSIETIENANGIEGNNVTGKRAKYILEERSADIQRFIFNTYFSHKLNNNFTLNGGVTSQLQRVHYYKTVLDLLGADFYVNLNQFAERDFPTDQTLNQNDIETPNRILREGDRFGYDYYSVTQVNEFWLQGRYKNRKWDLFAAGNLGQTSFYRDGRNRSGLFPDNSLGKSTKHNFTTFGIKGGATYKINGRNYLFTNGSYNHLAPQFRNVFVSPRTRDQVGSNLSTEKAAMVEGGYLYVSPKFKGRINAYYYQIEDMIRTQTFYHDEKRTFVNQTLSGLNTTHSGLEMAVDIKISPSFSVNGVAAIGNYFYTSRPTAELTEDNRPELISETKTIFLKNFFVAGTPQRAGSVGISYRSSRYWFANLNINFIDELYLDVNPERRTNAAIEGLEPGSVEMRRVINQEKAPANFSVDFFGGKSLKVNKYIKSASYNTFVYINLGVSNILNNQQMIIGGFEQLRFDFANKDVNRFPPRYFYNFGRTYFLNISYKF